MADSPLQLIEACEGGKGVTQNGNKIISSGEIAQPPKYVWPGSSQWRKQSNFPKQESPFKWMDEDEEFFYHLFAEREHSTERPTKTNIPAEPITPEQDKTQENQTPFVTPKRLTLHHCPNDHPSQKMSLRTSVKHSQHLKAPRGKCANQNICRTFGNQNWRNSKLNR